MLNNIFSVLDKLGVGTQKRAMSMRFSNTALNTQVMLQRLEGYHGINDGLSLLANSDSYAEFFSEVMETSRPTIQYRGI